MPPAAPKLKELRSRPNEVLDAARALFFARGYRGTTIQQIADRARYSKRTVYLDYQNKDELFITVCAEGGQLLLAKLREIPTRDLPVASSLERFLDVFISYSRDHSEYFRMIFSEATPSIVENCPAQLRARVAELERACLEVVVGWWKRAMRDKVIEPTDPWESAGILVGTATGIILLSMGGSQTVFSREALESLVKKATWTLWRGMQSAPPKSRRGGGHG